MPEFKVTWQQCPFVQYLPKANIVEADSEDEAREVIEDHIARVHNVSWYKVHSVEPHVKPKGRVLC